MTDSPEVALAKKLWRDATPDILAATVEAALADAKQFGGGLGGLPESALISHLEAAHAKVTAKALLNGSAQFTPSQLEWIVDVKNTYTKRALRPRADADGKPLAPNPGTLRTQFIKKYGLEKHEEALKLTGATTDLREPRIIAAAGNRGHLWGEQHGIETRTKRNHSWVNSGRLTIGGNYSRSPYEWPDETPGKITRL